MKIKSHAAALLVPMLFACNSQADRQALKEELKAELQAEQTAKENERLKEELKEAKEKASDAQAAASQAKAEAKVAKQKAAQAKPAPRVTPTSMNLTHVKISDLRGYTPTCATVPVAPSACASMPTWTTTSMSTASPTDGTTSPRSIAPMVRVCACIAATPAGGSTAASAIRSTDPSPTPAI